MSGFDPHSQSDMRRLGRSIAQNQRDTDWFRRNRRMIVEQLPGVHYGLTGTDFEVPDNLLEFQESVLMSHLSPDALRCSVRPIGNPDLNLAANRLRLRMNRLYEEINLSGAVRDCIQDSLNSMGILKTGMYPGKPVEHGGTTHRPGQIYSKIVDPDDFIVDATVREWDRPKYMGNRYRMAKRQAKENDAFDQDAVKDLVTYGTENTKRTAGGTETWGLTRPRNLEDAEYEEQVEVYDLWFPEERILVTVGCNDSSEASAIQETPLYVGTGPFPPGGLYDLLWYKRVSGNLLPQSPMAVLYDLHRLANALFRKGSDQAERQKTILGVLRKAIEDGERIKQTSDGEIIPLDDPNASREVRFGGTDPALLAFYLQTSRLFSERGGSLYLLGGAQAQSDTLGQDEILNSNAGARIRGMQKQIHEFVQEVMEKIGWYMWLKIDEWTVVNQPIRGTTGSIALRFSPAHLRGAPDDYEFSVEPYSMRPRTPGQRFATKAQLFQTLYLTNKEDVKSQGIDANFKEIFRDAAISLDVPEFEQWLMTGMRMPIGSNQGSGSEPYVPTNRFQGMSGNGRRGAQAPDPDAQIMQTFAGMMRDNNRPAG